MRSRHHLQHWGCSFVCVCVCVCVRVCVCVAYCIRLAIKVLRTVHADRTESAATTDKTRMRKQLVYYYDCSYCLSEEGNISVCNVKSLPFNSVFHLRRNFSQDGKNIHRCIINDLGRGPCWTSLSSWTLDKWKEWYSVWLQSLTVPMKKVLYISDHAIKPVTHYYS